MVFTAGFFVGRGNMDYAVVSEFEKNGFVVTVEKPLRSESEAKRLDEERVRNIAEILKAFENGTEQDEP